MCDLIWPGLGQHNVPFTSWGPGPGETSWKVGNLTYRAVVRVTAGQWEKAPWMSGTSGVMSRTARECLDVEEPTLSGSQVSTCISFTIFLAQQAFTTLHYRRKQSLLTFILVAIIITLLPYFTPCSCETSMLFVVNVIYFFGCAQSGLCPIFCTNENIRK